MKLTTFIFENKILAARLNHLFAMNPFSIPWKHQKNLRFSDVLGGRERVHFEQMS